MPQTFVLCNNTLKREKVQDLCYVFLWFLQGSVKAKWHIKQVSIVQTLHKSSAQSL